MEVIKGEDRNSKGRKVRQKRAVVVRKGPDEGEGMWYREEIRGEKGRKIKLKRAVLESEGLDG